MKHLKMIIAVVLVVCLSAGLAITGTLAFLTDRESKANVFTVGEVSIELNEEFEPGSTLIPGVEIEKKPTITNTGKNDAWVWLTFAIPAALDTWNPNSDEGSNLNAIHWNPMGVTTMGYIDDPNWGTEAKVEAAVAAGRLPDGTTYDDIIENQKYWDVFNNYVTYDGKAGNAYQETINVDGTDVLYNVYVIPYMKALTPGETTLPNIEKVFLDAQVDIDPNGDWYRVVDGEATKIDWNTNTNGTPIIYVSAYAIQADGFANVNDAYAAYQKQWGDNGAEYTPREEVPADAKLVTTFKELKDAFAEGGNIALANDIVFEEPIVMENGENVVLYMNGKTITPVSAKADPLFDTYPGTSLVITGNGTFDLGNNPGMSILMPGGDVTIKNGNFLKGRSDNVNGPMIAAYARAEGKFIIEGGYFDSGYYREGDCFNNCRNGVNMTSGNTYLIYGGTFVGQNPAWGDEGRAVLCPHCNNDGSNCQGVFLEGQTKTSTELPEGYTITEGTTADGRPTYTVTYSK